MHSWPIPSVPEVAGTPVPLALYDTADGVVRDVDTRGDEVGLYVCGITPYDSTHLGHAATYLTFDLVYRQLLANGHKVHYVQNITDVDDPLFERAERDGVDWRELGTSQIDLFRSDMEILSVIPPRDYIGAMEAVGEVVEMVQVLLDKGIAYPLVDASGARDIYAPISATEQFGYESNLDRATMEKYFAERGGDPDREGKRDPLDALLWRGHRDGEPAWDAPFGSGRPGWHIECSAIATNRLGQTFSIQGGGSDLAFPHHEFSAAHAEAAYDVERMAGHYVHTGMIALDGVKMSKSLGNLVFVHKLTEQGHEAGAIRLAVFSGHYRNDRDFSYGILDEAEARLARWRESLAGEVSEEEAVGVVDKLRAALANDLDTVTALQAVDDAAGDHDGIIARALDGLLGVQLR
ncbi:MULTISPECIES: cysteine--1-D-myo-inosityl 2-amino-2-deoxy-alpha-D-glucopyranoside ligase [unclassified Corynebacterium]|uniref:cysteine--1-D-myo-inosityl 2-amino-2-deoxy-alpha-D-glucopyranoside ligase n=1 Tax=unclassified Corynebacterium TaxID=2624378 RepID=UPI0021AA4DF6|nr:MULTISPECIES: cysteine--1-D-myo-inosityl 2-amino-2-deoxy-alpha-D-glucopyranoside ligase [unclassified Corynebacterium]MCT1452964.1 cysteine--1-D-myo-inosityl 2-amino-2-deoxy-alpha-D-glucopyranoside ligase [Corynebacterium sp. p3-SID1145]MCT1461991.1 cysteine--1-D-myo-inosityl 2-amino-2-deoxy-alpha-D-glucopyranoside ligase [Corynebacterium sp. p3-SID1140]MDN8594737.1 cysteine--1-D-myo-inosityl 2-amino-2-deoxy-alpha-D-glucopyranoside ligase [Corynebacterium sp. P4_F2]WKK56066.1 cysteine--1-D-m